MRWRKKLAVPLSYIDDPTLTPGDLGVGIELDGGLESGPAPGGGQILGLVAFMQLVYACFVCRSCCKLSGVIRSYRAEFTFSG